MLYLWKNYLPNTITVMYISPNIGMLYADLLYYASGASKMRPVGLNNIISDRIEAKWTGILSDTWVDRAIARFCRVSTKYYAFVVIGFALNFWNFLWICRCRKPYQWVYLGRQLIFSFQGQQALLLSLWWSIIL